MIEFMIEEKLKNNIFYQVNLINQKIEKLETSMVKLEDELRETISILKNHLVRVKNSERLPDENIIESRSYLDLSPEKAFELYNEKDKDFYVLDVSDKHYTSSLVIPEANKIPFEELKFRINELPNKSTPILIISENGTRSILACELLASFNYHNVNNVSGGYDYWLGQTKPQLKSA